MRNPLQPLSTAMELAPLIELGDNTPVQYEATPPRPTAPHVAGRVHRDLFGDAVEITEPTNDDVLRASDRFQSTRMELLNTFEPIQSGPEKELEQSIDSFFAERNLRTAPAVILSAARWQELEEYFTATNIGRSRLPSSSPAVYMPEYDVILCRKDPELGAGPGAFMRILAEKKAQSTAENTEVMLDEHNTLLTKHGYTYNDYKNMNNARQYGYFLEQGFIGLMAADYFRSIGRPEGLVTGVADARLSGSSKNYDLAIRSDDNTILGIMSIPGVHLSISATGDLVIFNSGYPGQALELITQFPEQHTGTNFYASLLEARQNDHDSFEAMETIVSAFNSLRPNLYRAINDLHPDTANLKTGLYIVNKLLRQI